MAVNKNEIRLTLSEFEILSCMMTRPNQVFSRARLMESVQGYSFEGYERTIDFHIKNLRKKIGRHLPDKPFIQSDYGVGYRLADF